MIAFLLAAAALAAQAPPPAPPTAVEARPATHGAAQAERQIRAQRGAFNRAIAIGDIKAIAAILADNVQLITGTDSKLVAGKTAQLAKWTQDLRDPSRGIYVRTPDRIRVSSIRPMALETGHWRGVDTASAKDWAAGDYVAKWRRIDGAWRIESETYMTLACGGTYCPKKER